MSTSVNQKKKKENQNPRWAPKPIHGPTESIQVRRPPPSLLAAAVAGYGSCLTPRSSPPCNSPRSRLVAVPDVGGVSLMPTSPYSLVQMRDKDFAKVGSETPGRLQLHCQRLNPPALSSASGQWRGRRLTATIAAPP